MMDEALLTVADVMAPTTLSVATRDTVVAAAEIIRRHGLAGLPVLEEGRLLGLVTAQQLLLEPSYRPVGDVMTRGITPATSDLSLLQAYVLMTRQGVEVLPVFEAGAVVGQISIASVLRAQGQQTDPLTNLPWATALRSWASAALAHGREITILFIDLDNFGELNKTFGHVAGDDILRSIAHLLGSVTDQATDLLCRYGGDEFAIATTGQEDDVRTLVERIQDTAVLPVEIRGTHSHVTVSIGVAGGRRVEGRKQTHAPATVEDLISLASQASTAVKEAKGLSARTGSLAAYILRGIEPAIEAPARRPPGGGPPGAPAEVRMQAVDVVVHADEGGCAVIVTLRLGRREGSGRAAGPVRGRGVLFLVAEATLAAIRRTIGERHTYVLEDLTEVPTAKDNLVVAVLGSPSNTTLGYVGGARAPDLNQAVTKAILDALNRPLGRTLAEYLRDDVVSE